MGGIALVEQHQRRLRDAAVLVDAIKRGRIAFEPQVELQAALQRRRVAAQRGDALQRREDRAAGCSVDALLPEVVAVAGVLGATAHKAGFRTVVQHRDAARGEQPIVRIDEAFVAGIHARHVVVVVERRQVVRVRVGAAFEEQRRRQPLEARALVPEYLVHRLFHREVEHADLAMSGLGMDGDVLRVVVEGFPEHEESRAPGADALAEGLPERRRHPADGVDAEGIGALVDPLRVGTDEVVQHRRVRGVEIAELGEVAVIDRAMLRVHRPGGVVERMQRVVRGIELLRRQVLVVGDELALAVVNLAEHRLVLGHRPGRRTVVADDVEHQLHVAIVHRLGQVRERHARARQVFVDLVEVHAPVAVVAGLAAIGEDGAAPRRLASGEGLVRVLHDRRDPDRAEAHAVDVVEVVGESLEVAAEVADVAGHAIARRQRDVEGAVPATLVALVVGRIAVDEAVGDHEVHRLAGERFERAVEIFGHRGRRRRLRILAVACQQDKGQHQRQHGVDLHRSFSSKNGICHSPRLLSSRTQ